MTNSELIRLTAYDASFYESHKQGSLVSARAVVPRVLDLVPARSVVDFGCGLGTWLTVFREHGVEELLGLDGPYVDPVRLLIAREEFQAADLQKPIEFERPYDLAVCLEVAEHLPASCARTLVESLTKAAPIVLFSAALPGQRGTDHRNERWPLYWEKLFAKQGFRKHDVIRPLIWQDPGVELWYRHNIYLFARNSIRSFDGMPRFEPELVLFPSAILSGVTLWWSRPVTEGLLTVARWRSRIHRIWSDS